MESLAYLTAGLEGVGGRIKLRVEDFRVVEIPLYAPGGQGTHLYFRVRKRGIPTSAVVQRVARQLGVPPGAIGMAGLKDAQAITEQTFSVEHVQPRQVAKLRDDNFEVLWTNLHTNKLRQGHLAGNEFTIRIREVRAEDLPKARAILEVLAHRGVPNYFGPQRFGARGDNGQLGAAAVRGDLEGFLRLMLGGPRPEDPPDVRAARELFDKGELPAALRRWPGHYHNERRALATLVRTGGRARPAFAAVDKFSKRFYVAAFQSELFNRVLERRIGQIDTVLTGDLAQKVDSGGVFLVEDLAAEQPRAERFEISPTGPLFGYRVHLAEGEPGQVEQAVLAESGLTLDDWRKSGAHKVKGARRALRYPVNEPGCDAGEDVHGPYIELRFIAPPGCYATTLLREVMKTEPTEAAAETGDEGEGDEE